MADVTIDGTIGGGTSRGMCSLVFTSESVGYQFYCDSGGTLVYSKTTDGGATWGAPVTVDADTSIVAFSVWFDQWTPGDAGTLIHIWYFGTSADDVTWKSLNTASDTLGTARVVLNGATSVAGRGVFVSGTKTRSGYLYCAFDIDAGAEKGLHRSTDGGTTWSANLSTTFVEATVDQCWLFPATGTGDDNDCWAIYHDASVDAVTLKLWDSSAASATESATIATVIENTTDLTGQYPLSASVRHSDGHLILSVITERDTVTADHRVFDITSTSTFSELTAITTNIDDHYYPSVFIDQNTNDIYVAYNGKNDGLEVLGTTTHIYYQKSTNGGTSWNAAVQYSEGATSAKLQTWAPLMGPRFYVSWRVSGILLGNAVNSLDLSAAGSYTITPLAGALAITSIAPVVTRQNTIVPTAGAIVITGVAPVPTINTSITPAVGALTITGPPPLVTQATVIIPPVGSLGLTGIASSVVLADTIRPTTGALSLTGVAPVVSIAAGGTSITPDTGALTLTGVAPVVTRQDAARPVAGALTLTGVAPVVRRADTITPATGTLSLAGIAPAVTRQDTIRPTAGALTLSGVAPAVTQGTVRVPVAGAMTLAGVAPAATQSIARETGTGALNLTGAAPVVTRQDTIQPGTGALTATGATPELGGARLITPATGALALTGVSPAVQQATVITPATGSLALSGVAGSVRRADTIQPATGVLSLAGAAPEALRADRIAPNTGGLILSGVAAQAAQQIIRQPTTGVLTVAGTPPVLNLRIVPSSGTLTVAGVTAAVAQTGLAFVITPTTGVLTITGVPPETAAFIEARGMLLLDGRITRFTLRRRDTGMVL